MLWIKKSHLNLFFLATFFSSSYVSLFLVKILMKHETQSVLSYFLNILIMRDCLIIWDMIFLIKVLMYLILMIQTITICSFHLLNMLMDSLHLESIIFNIKVYVINILHHSKLFVFRIQFLEVLQKSRQ